jgi:hypothetical protein
MMDEDKIRKKEIEKIIQKILKASCTCKNGEGIVCVGCFYRKDLATAIHALIEGRAK